MIPTGFSEHEAAFLAEYRQLCERHGICLVTEVTGALALVDFGENPIWGCTVVEMVDRQMSEMSEAACR